MKILVAAAVLSAVIGPASIAQSFYTPHQDAFRCGQTQWSSGADTTFLGASSYARAPYGGSGYSEFSPELSGGGSAGYNMGVHDSVLNR